MLDGSSDGDDSTLSWLAFLSLSSSPPPAQAKVDVMKDVAVLPFSSGTTGKPKVGDALFQYKN